jgi:chorismate mutase
MTELLEQISSIDFEYVKGMEREEKVLKSLKAIRETFKKRGCASPDLEAILAMKMDDLQTTIEEANNAISRK